MSSVKILIPTELDETNILKFQGSLKRAIEKESVKIITLVGNEANFCRGMNLGFLSQHARQKNFKAIKAYVDLVNDIYHCPKITLAVIEGETLGGGLGLAALCDYVLATEQARFGLPEALFGMLPGIVMPSLSLRVLPYHIKRMALTVTTWNAIEAKAIGVVDQVVPSNELPTALSFIRKNFGRCDPKSIKSIKKLINEREFSEFRKKMEIGAQLLMERLSDPDTLDKIDNFNQYGLVDWDKSNVSN